MLYEFILFYGKFWFHSISISFSLAKCNWSKYVWFHSYTAFWLEIDFEVVLEDEKVPNSNPSLSATFEVQLNGTLKDKSLLSGFTSAARDFRTAEMVSHATSPKAFNSSDCTLTALLAGSNRHCSQLTPFRIELHLFYSRFSSFLNSFSYFLHIELLQFSKFIIICHYNIGLLQYFCI